MDKRPGYFTYREYKTWPDDERWELIDGHAWAMSPAPIRPHQKLSGRLFRTIGNFLEGKFREVYAAPFDSTARDSAHYNPFLAVQGAKRPTSFFLIGMRTKTTY